jgi:hypothetical protein
MSIGCEEGGGPEPRHRVGEPALRENRRNGRAKSFRDYVFQGTEAAMSVGPWKSLLPTSGKTQPEFIDKY